MKNPVNDRDLEVELPKLVRQLYVLGYIESAVDQLSEWVRDDIKRIYGNAKENNYTDKMVQDTRGKTFLMVGDEEIILKKIQKMIAYNSTILRKPRSKNEITETKN